MPETSYPLTRRETTKLVEALAAAYSIPLIDDVEDFVWESVFHYVKNIQLPDPIAEGRTKRLFDAVAGDGRGWSLKTLLWNNLEPGSSFEFVIQRADIFKKWRSLGFRQKLKPESRVKTLGSALIKHWNQKFDRDAELQKVRDPRIAILLKDRARRRFVYLEFAYPRLNEADFTWQWATPDGLGLRGSRDGSVRLKWYHGQKQLFQVYQIPARPKRLSINWQRIGLSTFVSRWRAMRAQ